MKLQDVITAEGLKLTRCERTDSNPHMENGASMDHWRVTIKGPGGQMSLTFSMGFGHNGKEPKLPEILDCLAADASMAGESFESWCSDLGYDTDSRRAHKTYKTVTKQAAKFRRALGAAYDAVLEAERL